MKRTYIVGSHQLALYYWSFCIQKEILKKYATVIHIDFHSDFLDHRVSYVSDNPDDIFKLISDKEIQFDTFIKYAISANMINEVIFCCKPQSGEMNNVDPFINYHSPVLLVDSLLRKDIHLPANLILDIDLDYFIDFESEIIKLKTESQIIEEIEAINKLFQYAKVTTISTSQDWSWEREHWEFVQNLFERYFNSPVSFSCNPEQIF